MLRYRLFAVISRFTPTVGLPATLDRRRVNSEESAPLMMRSNNADLGADEFTPFLVQPRNTSVWRSVALRCAPH